MKKYEIVITNRCAGINKASNSLEEMINRKRKEHNNVQFLGGPQIITEREGTIALQAIEYEE